MATAENTTVNLYSGVPLVKGGTEVLYLSGSAAVGALSGYLTFTGTRYYYTRENRGSVQVESPIAPVEECNYIAFQNVSHGGKWYFGFIDRIVYVNDRNTQIEFTIDPFPTYLDEVVEAQEYYVLRNTPKTDVRGANLQNDFMPDSDRKKIWTLANYSLAFDRNVVYFAAPSTTATVIDGTGSIYIGILTSQLVQDINQNGGTIIGAYMYPTGGSWSGAAVQAAFPLTVLTGNPGSGLIGSYMNKIRTGVYNKVMLITSQGAKSYELEAFANPQSVSFRVLGMTIPSPALFVYPLDYNGIAENIAEGMMCKAPALPISANSVYTNAQGFSDLVSGIISTGTGAVGGFLKGGVAGAVIGAGVGAVGALVNQAKNVQMSNLKAPTVYGTGEPVVNLNRELFCTLAVCSPDERDLDRIDNYFRYYGYAQNAVSTSTEVFPSGVNLDDGAYLQTGSEMFSGSVGAAEMNERVASGIKIRKTL